MAAKFRSPIETIVDRLFAKMNAKRGEYCVNPVTGGKFIWGDDPIAPQKKAAVAALRAQEWFAINGPADAPPLPISGAEIDDYRRARGFVGVVGFYARSVARLRWNVREHPSFEDFVCGLMATDTGMWGIEKDESLKKR